MINERFQESDDVVTKVSVTPDVIRLDWAYTERAMYVDMFTPEWTLWDQKIIGVVSATLGSPIIHVVSTSDVVVGNEYIIEGSNTTQIIRVQAVDSVAKTVTAYSALSANYSSGVLKRSNFLLYTGYAEGRYAKYYYLGPLDLGNRDSDKKVIIRRLDNNATLNVYYRKSSSANWVSASVTHGTADAFSVVEDVYSLGGSRGLTDIKLISNIAGYTESLILYSVFVIDPDIFKTISTSTIFYLSTEGSDSNGDGSESSPWYSIDKVMDYLSPYWISSEVSVTIRIAAGHYSYSAPTTIYHPCGDRIFIEGEYKLDVDITGFVSATAGPLDSETGLVSWSVVLDVGTTLGTFEYSVGDYLLIHSNSTPGTLCVLHGCHKIISVDQGTGYIGIIIKYPNTIQFPTPALCSFKGYLLKTVLQYSNSGIFLNGKRRIGAISNLAIEGSSASATSGYAGICGYFQDVVTLRRVGIVNFNKGIYINSLLVHGYGTVSAEGTESDGATAISGCYYGYIVENMVSTVRALAAGNVIGFWSRSLSNYTFRNIGCIATGNVSYGIRCDGGRLNATGCIIGDNAPVQGCSIYAGKAGYVLAANYSLIGENNSGTIMSPAVNTVGNEQGYIDT